jgi:uncharacterized protein YpiB (UPF0302 family)
MFHEYPINVSFVVLLVCHFKDMYLDLVVLLNLIGNDLYKVSFSKISGMKGHERAYDVHELVNTANTLNYIPTIKYEKDGLAFKSQHDKMENVSEALHKLQLERSDVIWVTIH